MSPNRRLHSNKYTCPYKVKLTTENAMPYLLAAQKDTKKYGPNSKDLELYVCAACSHLHIGHKLGTRRKH